MLCSKCGHELKETMNVCSHCGAAQGVAATAPNQPNALSQRKAPEEYNFRTDKGAMGTISMVLGILLIVVALLFILLWGLIFLVLFFWAGERDIVGMVCFSSFGIGMLLLCVIVGVANILTSYEVITFTGRQITVKRIGKTRTYDCADIMEIKCVTRSAYFGLIPVYYIEWKMIDGKKYKKSSAGKNFQQIAGYFLTMLDAGITSKEAITQDNKEKLTEYEKGVS